MAACSSVGDPRGPGDFGSAATCQLSTVPTTSGNTAAYIALRFGSSARSSQPRMSKGSPYRARHGGFEQNRTDPWGRVRPGGQTRGPSRDFRCVGEPRVAGCRRCRRFDARIRKAVDGHCRNQVVEATYVHDQIAAFLLAQNIRVARAPHDVAIEVTLARVNRLERGVV